MLNIFVFFLNGVLAQQKVFWCFCTWNFVMMNCIPKNVTKINTYPEAAPEEHIGMTRVVMTDIIRSPMKSIIQFHSASLLKLYLVLYVVCTFCIIFSGKCVLIEIWYPFTARSGDVYSCKKPQCRFVHHDRLLTIFFLVAVDLDHFFGTSFITKEMK